MIFFAQHPENAHSAEKQKERFKVAAPFSTPGLALLFAAIVLALTAGPSLLAVIWPQGAASKYGSIPLTYGNYHTAGHEAALGGDVDVLILGASDAWTGLDPEVMATELSASLGRPARILNFGANWAGEERAAQMLRDLEGRLRPRLILGVENDALQNIPHELAKFWWRGGVTTAGLDWQARAQLHMMHVLGLPHQLRSRMGLADRPMTPGFQAYTKRLIDSRGFNGEARGWRSHLEPNEANRRAMPSVEPPAPSLDPSAMVFKGVEDANFRLQYYTYSPFQSHFYRQVSALAKAQGAVYATVALPTHFKDKPLDKVIVRELSDKRPRDWRVIGISQAAMFPSMSFEDMKAYYSNESHLNSIGARAFTRALMPAIRTLHAQAPPR